MLMHGVKGELLTRIRLLVSLAAVRGERSHRFPRFLPVPSAHRALRAVSRRRLGSPRVCAQLQWTVPIAASVWNSCTTSPSNLRRIFSIEPLISGAGKEAAYDGPDAASEFIAIVRDAAAGGGWNRYAQRNLAR